MLTCRDVERLTLAAAFFLTVVVGCRDAGEPPPSPPPACEGGVCESEPAAADPCSTFKGELVRSDLPSRVDDIVVSGDWLFATLEARGEGGRDVIGARLDGTGTPRLVTTVPDAFVTNTREMAISGGYLYVRDTRGLQRVSLPLADPPEVVSVATGVTHLYDATPTHLFVGRDDRLVRMNGATSELGTVLDVAPILGDIALTPSRAYWRHVALPVDAGTGPVAAANEEVMFAAIDGGAATASGVKAESRNANNLGAHESSVFYFSLDGTLFGIDVATKSAPRVVRASTGQLRGAWGEDGYYYFSRRLDASSECWGLWRVDLSGQRSGDEWVGEVGSRAHTIHPHGDWVYVVYSVGTTAVRRIRKL